MQPTVLFDLDGTLLDSEPDFTSILNEMLADRGMGVSSSVMRQTVSSGARAMVSLAYGIDDTHSEFEACVGNFLDRYESAIPETKACLFDGIAELLGTLEEKAFPWAIMTNKSSRFTLPLIARFPEFENAAAVICADQVPAGKPAPDGLIQACHACGCTVEQALYVGDHPRDIEAAINAGMPGIAVTWGYLPASPPIHEWHASAIMHTPEELLRYITASH